MSIIQEQFDKLVDQFSMLDTKSVLLGLSGGADSSVLLDLLNKARPKYGFDLKCVHINHMIRADEAFRDENFCKLTCEKLGVELIVVRECSGVYGAGLAGVPVRRLLFAMTRLAV